MYDAGLAVLRTEGDVPTAALGAPARRDDPEQLSSQLGTTPQARISYGQRYVFAKSVAVNCLPSVMEFSDGQMSLLCAAATKGVAACGTQP
ncbi:hypothetical protein C5D36_09745 [Rathayibacter sp. AY1C6]|nr:hypothetical protein C5B93_03640 [Rathayibacter sp. AY1A2]PPG15368.1 hypothetical protein C5D36_09745 [Rathayibacter sp. AY1C6]PPG61995.1 hypothetical protein C5C69_06695 [Rathayibacter sp. AY1C7]PPH55787.1 hypothetical protein C5C67_02725 [Rathayibacter sp. AY1E1]